MTDDDSINLNRVRAEHDAMLAGLGPSPELQAAIIADFEAAHLDKVKKPRKQTKVYYQPGDMARRLVRLKERSETHPHVRKVTYQYQVRQIAGTREFGLYCPQHDDQHWYGHGGYRAVNGHAAKRFSTAEEARQFRSKLSPETQESE